MSSSLLERARSFHEDIETYEMAIIRQLEQKPRTNKERIYQQHRIKNLLIQVTKRNEELHAIYEDADSSHKRELANMRGRDALRNFYDCVKASWNYHAKFPELAVSHGPEVEKEMEPAVTFSGEELFGKFFDLHGFHTRWINMPQCSNKQMDYGNYLQSLKNFHEISVKSKKSKTYTVYLGDLERYLVDFLYRTQPLVEPADIISECNDEFEKSWVAGKIRGWTAQSNTKKHGSTSNSAKLLDLSLYHTAEDLMPLGLERLKEALEALSLKCGGTLAERAERLISVKGKTQNEIDPKLFAKVSAGKKRSNDSDLPSAKRQANGNGVANGNMEDSDWMKSTAFTEARIVAFLEAMVDVFESTIKQVEKKQTRSVEERDAEIADEEAGILPDVLEGDEEESEDEGPIYNPLNLPLGWDGKPIPFWLYKLHGLGVEFKCEICGDYSYWGRRAFDRHFQEWRHAHGMRCLGIPNTKHFHDITKIQDALDLYMKLKGQLQTEQWMPDTGEEFEDSDGNVLNRRTYEDLARQGLL